MKEKELRKHSVCVVCKRPIGHTRRPSFWIVKVEHWSIDMRAMQRQDNFAAFLGNTVLAQAMGADEDIAKQIDSVEVNICEQCAENESVPIAILMEWGWKEKGGE